MKCWCISRQRLDGFFFVKFFAKVRTQLNVPGRSKELNPSTKNVMEIIHQQSLVPWLRWDWAINRSVMINAVIKYMLWFCWRDANVRWHTQWRSRWLSSLLSRPHNAEGKTESSAIFNKKKTTTMFCKLNGKWHSSSSSYLHRGGLFCQIYATFSEHKINT